MFSFSVLHKLHVAGNVFSFTVIFPQDQEKYLAYSKYWLNKRISESMNEQQWHFANKGGEIGGHRIIRIFLIRTYKNILITIAITTNIPQFSFPDFFPFEAEEEVLLFSLATQF